jgi:hypothetical protein
MSYPAVVVRWVDSQSFGGWRDLEEAKQLVTEKDRLESTSIGYLFHEDKHSITIVQTLHRSQVADGMTIPRCAIKSLKRIN